MKTFFSWLAAAAVFSWTAAAPAAEVLERILAVVNDEIITEQDLELVMAPLLAQYRTLYTGQEYQDRFREARQEFLNKVIEDKLILSEARRRQVIVKDSEVDEMVVEVRNKFHKRELFLKAIHDQGLTEKKLWERFRDQLMTQKLVAYEVKSKVSVSPGEISEHYKVHSGEFAQGDRVRLRQILVRIGTRSEEDALAFAESLANQIRSGKSFEELAKSYSEGAEAREGGDMGWIEKGQFLGEIDEKIFALGEGEITLPIKSSLGYHLFRIVERQKFSVKPLVEVRDDIHETLFNQKMRDRLETWIKNLRRNAYISIR